MKATQRAVFLMLALILLSAPLANAENAPIVMPSEELAESAYFIYRALCAGYGFDVLPDEEVFLDYADDGSGLVIMARVPVDYAEWGVMYYYGEFFVGYSLCVHKDTQAIDRVDELEALFLTTLLVIAPEAAQELVIKLRDDMEDLGEPPGNLGILVVGNVRLIMAEDETRRLLMIMEEPNT